MQVCRAKVRRAATLVETCEICIVSFGKSNRRTENDWLSCIPRHHFFVITIYTIPVVANHGLGIIPIFFGDMAKMGWPGQFNLDFLGFLILSATWLAWRNNYSAKGIGLGVLGFFFGAPFLTAYLLFVSFKSDNDLAVMFLGERRAQSE